MGIAALVMAAAWSPRAEAAPVTGDPIAGSGAAQAGILTGFQLASLMIHLVGGVPPKHATPSPAPAFGVYRPMPLLELERRVMAGEEGLGRDWPR